MNRLSNDYFMSNQSDWTDFGEPVSKSELEVSDKDLTINSNETSPSIKTKKVSSRGVVITFQLMLCLLILTIAFVAKTFFQDDFNQMKAEYNKMLYSSMIFDGKLEDADYSTLFTVTSDED